MSVIKLRNNDFLINADFYVDELYNEYKVFSHRNEDTKEDVFDESRAPMLDIEAWMKVEPLLSKNQTKKLNKAESKKTLKKWFNLPRQEITDDVKVLNTREVWDTKTFYKGQDRAKQTEYFQRGAISNSIFTSSNSESKGNKNLDIIDNLLQSETLIRKMKKAEQSRQFNEKQKLLMKCSMKKKRKEKETKKHTIKKKQFKKSQ